MGIAQNKVIYMKSHFLKTLKSEKNVYNLIFELLAKGNMIIRRNMAAEHRGVWSRWAHAPDEAGACRFFCALRPRFCPP